MLTASCTAMGQWPKILQDYEKAVGLLLREALMLSEYAEAYGPGWFVDCRDVPEYRPASAGIRDGQQHGDEPRHTA